MTRRTLRKRDEKPTGTWHGASRKRRRARRLRAELLEPRRLLDGAPLPDYSAVSPAWFETVPHVLVGPHDDGLGALSGAAGGSAGTADVGERERWIVRLTDEATASAGSVWTVEHAAGHARRPTSR